MVSWVNRDAAEPHFVGQAPTFELTLFEHTSSPVELLAQPRDAFFASTGSHPATTTSKMNWDAEGGAFHGGYGDDADDGHGHSTTFDEHSQKHHEHKYPEGLSTGDWEPKWPCITFPAHKSEMPFQCAVFTMDEDSLLPTVVPAAAKPCTAKNHWLGLSVQCESMGPEVFVTGFSADKHEDEECCDEKYYVSTKGGQGDWNCDLCDRDIANRPWGEYLFCKGFEEHLKTVQVFTFLGNVFVVALYFVTIAVCAQQPLSNHMAASCSKLIVEGLEWFRYLHALGFGTWAIIAAVLCLVYGIFAPKFNCYVTADVMLYYTPLLSASSVLILVFVPKSV